MAKVKRSTPAPAPASKPKAPSSKAAKSKSSASAGAADAAAKSPAAAAAASPPVVIEIPSSPDPSVGVGSKGSSGSNKKGRKRPAPPPPFDLDDEIEMWTPRQKVRRDEDCQILAADPLSATTEVTPSSAAANDEITVVAERGKVACRDYPHPRSACAKNPFGTTPHERHCEKCFCYVCDVAAPCVSWKGYGGHCHASDKDQKWKAMRLMMKKAMQIKPI
ncbi:unnamed protein product [Urochloa humidicola]